MTTKDKLIEKMEEYISWLESTYKIEYYSQPPIFQKEIASLKSEVEKESEHKLSVCSCGIPEPDIDRECCTICEKLIYD